MMTPDPLARTIDEDPLFKVLRDSTLWKMVDDYDALEDKITRTSITDFKNYVRQQKLGVWVHGRRDDVTRVLRVGLFKNPAFEVSHEHNISLAGVGRVQSVTVESDTLKPSTIARYADVLARIVERHYDAFVAALEIHTKEASHHSLDTCRALVAMALQKERGLSFYDDCWLIAADSESGSLLLTEDVLHRALVHFGTKDNSQLSPLELLVNLVRSKFPFPRTVSFLAHRHNKPKLYGDFGGSKYRQVAMDIWMAIGTLHDFEDFAVIPLARAGDRTLTLGCKALVADRVVERLTPHLASIQVAFKRGAYRFSPIVAPQPPLPPEMKAVVDGSIAPMRTGRGYTVFFSYSHADKDVVTMLKDTLAPVIDSEQINFVFDGSIPEGEVWRPELRDRIAHADAGVFLVSRASLVSRVIMQMELPLMLARGDEVEIRWLPIQHCLWEETPFERLQASWLPSKPLLDMGPSEQDFAIKKFCANLRKVALRKTS